MTVHGSAEEANSGPGQRADPGVVVEVEFNQQQDVVLDQLRETGEFGSDDAEIVRNVFRAYLRLTGLP